MDTTFVFPASALDDAAAMSARTRTASMEARSRPGVRLAPAPPVVVADEPIVQVPPADPDDWDAPVEYRAPTDGETPTHYRRTLRFAEEGQPESRDPELLVDVDLEEALSALIAARDIPKPDTTGWGPEQWIEDARRVMAHQHGSVHALTDNHVAAMLDRLAPAATPVKLRNIP